MGSHLPDQHADALAEAEDESSLTGWPEKVNRQDILNAIPSKDFADSLVAVCFTNTNNEASTSAHHPIDDSSRLTLTVIVHPPTFRKEVSSGRLTTG